jgi:thioredoxin reductase (NADPH)
MQGAGRVRDVIIVGSGPAGYTAAIYAARAGLDTLVVEGHLPGGALMAAGQIDNYPGISVPVCGPGLARAMRAQAHRFGAEFHAGEVDGFDLDGEVKSVAVNEELRHASALILRASTAMVARLRAQPNVVVLDSTVVLAVKGSHRVTGLRVRKVDTATECDMDLSAVFVAIGQTPRSDLLMGLVDLDARGYVVTRGVGTNTCVDGVFAVGDLIDSRYHQGVTAAASGCQAALDAQRWLAQLHTATTNITVRKEHTSK